MLLETFNSNANHGRFGAPATGLGYGGPRVAVLQPGLAGGKAP